MSPLTLPLYHSTQQFGENLYLEFVWGYVCSSGRVNHVPVSIPTDATCEDASACDADGSQCADSGKWLFLSGLGSATVTFMISTFVSCECRSVSKAVGGHV